MNKEVVDVIEVANNRVKVKFKKSKSCSCCNLFSFCHRGNEGIWINSEPEIILDKGDRIEVGIEGKRTILASFIVFLAPAVIFISVPFIFREWSELRGFFLAIASLLIYYLIVKLVMRRRKKYFNLQILRKI